MTLRAKLAHLIPQSILNNVLLTFPSLYKTKLISYESNVILGGSIDEFLEPFSESLEIDGDIIECGSARCGTSIFMALQLQSKKIDKKIFACDTFSGFDLSELKTEQQSGLTSASEDAFTHNSYDYVKMKIDKLGFSNMITPIKGLFQETLPTLERKYSFAFVDCDLKQSIIFSIEYIWPRLNSGGVILIDDYTNDLYKGAKEAVDHLTNKFQDEIKEKKLLRYLYYIKKL